MPECLGALYFGYFIHRFRGITSHSFDCSIQFIFSFFVISIWFFHFLGEQWADVAGVCLWNSLLSSIRWAQAYTILTSFSFLRLTNAFMHRKAMTDCIYLYAYFTFLLELPESNHLTVSILFDTIFDTLYLCEWIQAKVSFAGRVKCSDFAIFGGSRWHWTGKKRI